MLLRSDPVIFWIKDKSPAIPAAAVVLLARVNVAISLEPQRSTLWTCLSWYRDAPPNLRPISAAGLESHEPSKSITWIPLPSDHGVAPRFAHCAIRSLHTASSEAGSPATRVCFMTRG